MIELINELKSLVAIIESLENFQHVYPLDSDQQIELRESEKRMREIIKQL